MFVRLQRYCGDGCALFILLYVIASVFVTWAVALPLFDPAYRGLLPYLSADHLYYALHVQEALLGGDVSNGIFSLGNVSGVQPVGLEIVAGWLFGWTHLTGGDVVRIVTLVVFPLWLPLGYIVLRKTGSSRIVAMVAAAGFFWLNILAVHRYVHQSWSFPCFLIGLWLLVRWWQSPRFSTAVAAGAWTGMMTQVYFWNWTFLATVLGCLTLCTVLPRCTRGTNGSVYRRTLPVLWGAFFLLALPYIVQTLGNLQSPFFAETARRSALLLTREIESWPRSIVTVVLAVSGIVTAYRYADQKHLGPLLALASAPALVLNQQLIHGRVISFSTHFVPFISFATVVLMAWAWSHRRTVSWSGWIIVAAGLIFNAPLAMERGWSLSFFRTQVSNYSFQHLASAMTVLRSDGAKDVILTDKETALHVAAHTDDDVVFVEYIRHLLLPTSEYAERFCLSELPSDPPVSGEEVPEQLRELSRVGQTQISEAFRENAATARLACCTVRKDPAASLQHYGVTALLWDEILHPDWRIDSKLFSVRERGDGWSLWRLNDLKTGDVDARLQSARSSCMAL
ncbi:MAG: hypothetical protein PHZ00_01740 [Candidatus Peribacteraceae bacterium]|nr:hypothetical protein [Candidatus Peribacteraceae bacterium]